MNTAIEYLEQTAAMYPTAPAIEDITEIIDYNSLQQRAKSVGTGLIACGFCEKPVLIYLPESAKSLYAFYGVLYSGQAYVPLDYNDAKNRLVTIIESFPHSIIITCEDGKKRLNGWGQSSKTVLIDDLIACKIDNEVISRRLNGVIDTDPIYIMHTSGSTGMPKGVVVSHKGVMDFTDWAVSAFPVKPDSVIGLQSPLHFDASVFDIYSCIASGAKLVMIPQNLLRFPKMLLHFMDEKKISCFFWVPRLLVTIANSGELQKNIVSSLETITFVGEVMPVPQLKMWMESYPHCDFINLYGPTETTVASTWYPLGDTVISMTSIPIGKPCKNTRIILLTEDGRVAEKYEPGEICIGGSGVALGYWNNREMTDKAFIQYPVNNSYHERIYRTGDLGVENKNGDILFLGRKDTQIKAKGVRVELGDIESAAACIKGVKAACAVFSSKTQQIVLFIESDRSWTLREFKKELLVHIPSYMLPEKLFVLDNLPQNRNGKIDKIHIKNKYLGE